MLVIFISWMLYILLLQVAPRPASTNDLPDSRWDSQKT